MNYLSSLKVSELFFEHPPKKTEKELTLRYGKNVKGEKVSCMLLSLYPDRINVYRPFHKKHSLSFFLDEALDWTYLMSLLDFEAESPRLEPKVPEMMLEIIEKPDLPLLHTSKQALTLRKKKEDLKKEREWMQTDPLVISDLPITKIKLHFSSMPILDYTILVEDLQRDHSYMLSSKKIEGNLLPLAPYSAHYTIDASFHSSGDGILEMSYSFDVILPEN